MIRRTDTGATNATFTISCSSASERSAGAGCSRRACGLKTQRALPDEPSGAHETTTPSPPPTTSPLRPSARSMCWYRFHVSSGSPSSCEWPPPCEWEWPCDMWAGWKPSEGELRHDGDLPGRREGELGCAALLEPAAEGLRCEEVDCEAPPLRAVREVVQGRAAEAVERTRHAVQILSASHGDGSVLLREALELLQGAQLESGYGGAGSALLARDEADGIGEADGAA